MTLKFDRVPHFVIEDICISKVGYASCDIAARELEGSRVGQKAVIAYVFAIKLNSSCTR